MFLLKCAEVSVGTIFKMLILLGECVVIVKIEHRVNEIEEEGKGTNAQVRA